MRKLVTLMLGMISFTTYASHIVGGEMYFDCLGNNNYKIHLQVYRDCAAFGPNVADFDSPAYIGVYDSNGNLVIFDSVFYTLRDTIPLSTGNPCYAVPPNICVEKADYVFTENLPPIAGGV